MKTLSSWFQSFSQDNYSSREYNDNILVGGNKHGRLWLLFVLSFKSSQEIDSSYLKLNLIVFDIVPLWILRGQIQWVQK